MFKFFFHEFNEIKNFLKENYKVITILVVSMLYFTLQWYRPIGSNQAISQIVYFIVIPFLAIYFLLKDNPLNYGFGLGDFLTWLYYVIITVAFCLPFLILAPKLSQVNTYYGKGFSYKNFFIITVPVLLAWEYILRGFLLFGLKERFGKMGIVIQTIPFVLLHLGKPEIETLSCIITGLWFGWIAYRGNSFWPAFIVHVFINFTVNILVNF